MKTTNPLIVTLIKEIEQQGAPTAETGQKIAYDMKSPADFYPLALALANPALPARARPYLYIALRVMSGYIPAAAAFDDYIRNHNRIPRSIPKGTLDSRGGSTGIRLSEFEWACIALIEQAALLSHKTVKGRPMGIGTTAAIRYALAYTAYELMGKLEGWYNVE